MPIARKHALGCFSLICILLGLVVAYLTGSLPHVSSSRHRAHRSVPVSVPTRFEGEVVSVSDGDTLSVMLNGAPVKVRLQGVDCPESSQPFGRNAKSFTSSLVFGKTVRAVCFDTDRYGRSVCDIYLPDGRCLNQELVKSGLAWWYRQYSSDPVLEKFEQSARSRHKGLWSDPDPVAPWDYRKEE